MSDPNVFPFGGGNSDFEGMMHAAFVADPEVMATPTPWGEEGWDFDEGQLELIRTALRDVPLFRPTLHDAYHEHASIAAIGERPLRLPAIAVAGQAMYAAWLSRNVYPQDLYAALSQEDQYYREGREAQDREIVARIDHTGRDRVTTQQRDAQHRLDPRTRLNVYGRVMEVVYGDRWWKYVEARALRGEPVGTFGVYIEDIDG